jgi:hypothetical protein
MTLTQRQPYSDRNTRFALYGRVVVPNVEYHQFSEHQVVSGCVPSLPFPLDSPHVNPGIPLNDSANLRLGIAEVGQAILGSNLLGFQVGNEPDLYAAYVSYQRLNDGVPHFASSATDIALRLMAPKTTLASSAT